LIIEQKLTLKVITALSLIIGKISWTNFSWAKQCSGNLVKTWFSKSNERTWNGNMRSTIYIQKI